MESLLLIWRASDGMRGGFCFIFGVVAVGEKVQSRDHTCNDESDTSCAHTRAKRVLIRPAAFLLMSRQ